MSLQDLFMSLSPEAKSIPANDIANTEPHAQPQRYTKAEIDRFILVPPSPELLSEGHPYKTPVGEWHMEGPEAIFKPIQQPLIDQMTIPDRKEQIISAIKRFGRMD